MSQALGSSGSRLNATVLLKFGTFGMLCIPLYAVCFCGGVDVAMGGAVSPTTHLDARAFGSSVHCDELVVSDSVEQRSEASPLEPLAMAQAAKKRSSVSYG